MARPAAENTAVCVSGEWREYQRQIADQGGGEADGQPGSTRRIAVSAAMPACHSISQPMQREVYGDAQQARAYDQRQDVNLSEHRYAGRGACGQSGDGRQKGQQCACATQREQQHQNDANERGCANTAAFMGRLLLRLATASAWRNAAEMRAPMSASKGFLVVVRLCQDPGARRRRAAGYARRGWPGLEVLEGHQAHAVAQRASPSATARWRSAWPTSTIIC